MAAFPLHADAFHAEVVVSLHFENQLLSVEHHFLPWQVFHRQRRRLVIANRNGELKRIFACQIVFVFPLQRQLLRLGEAHFRRRDGRAIGFRGLIVDLCAIEVAAGSG